MYRFIICSFITYNLFQFDDHLLYRRIKYFLLTKKFPAVFCTPSLLLLLETFPDPRIPGFCFATFRAQTCVFVFAVLFLTSYSLFIGYRLLYLTFTLSLLFHEGRIQIVSILRFVFCRIVFLDSRGLRQSDGMFKFSFKRM